MATEKDVTQRVAEALEGISRKMDDLIDVVKMTGENVHSLRTDLREIEDALKEQSRRK